MASEASLNFPARGNNKNGSDFVGSLRGTYRSASDARRSSLAGRYQSQYRGQTSKKDARNSLQRDSLAGPESLEYVEKSPKSSESPKTMSSLDPTCPQLPPIEPTIELLSEAHIACHIVVTDTDLTETVIIDRNETIPSQVISEHTRHSKDNKVILNSNLINEPRTYNSTPTYLTHLPPAFLARRGYLPSIYSSILQSPIELDLQDEIILEPSHRDELRELWNCASGWQVSPYEGRRFCLKITIVHADVPIYVLSSSTQAFYSIKYTATPNSTQMNVMRYDPEKSASISILGFSKFGKGVDVVSTTLEKNARQIPLEDGLVALLYPRAASNKLIQLATKISKRDTCEVTAATLEKECGRLVWEGDSGNYFLCHPAMRTPFLISITTTPETSTIKYMLEHTEFQRDIVTLVRDTAGGGFLEIDTSCVTRIASTCIIDVAVSAIMLVAILTEEKMLEIDRINLAVAMELKRQSQFVTQDSSSTVGTECNEKLDPDIESQNDKPSEQKGEVERTPALSVLESMITRVLIALNYLLKIFQSKKKPHEEIK